MKFFDNQYQARRRIAVLAISFVLAVLFIIGAIYFTIIGCLHLVATNARVGQARVGWWLPEIFKWVAIVTPTVIVGGAVIKILMVDNKRFVPGTDIPLRRAYLFFLVHMLMFGGSGFLMAYSEKHPPIRFLYLHGGIAIAVYTIFYLRIFGMDEVKWMFINAGLGLLGIYSQIDWILLFFGKDVRSYPIDIHVVPFLYYVLYTFLIRHVILDVTQSREDEQKKKSVERIYIAVSLAIDLTFYVLARR